MCNSLQTKRECRNHNKSSKKWTEDADSVETTTNQARDKRSENIKILIAITLSENIETTIKLISDKTT